jgi:hypothetical protein
MDIFTFQGDATDKEKRPEFYCIVPGCLCKVAHLRLIDEGSQFEGGGSFIREFNVDCHRGYCPQHQAYRINEERIAAFERANG